MERYDRMANNQQARDLVYKFAAAMKKRAAMHATEAEQSEARARTADPPATGTQQAVTAIERAGMTPARELSPRVRKKKGEIPPGAFMSRQRVEGGMIKRYRP